jgi:hypothetical protein
LSPCHLVTLSSVHIRGAGVEPAASAFKARRPYRHRLPAITKLPRHDSNVDYLVQSQACYRLHHRARAVIGNGPGRNRTGIARVQVSHLPVGPRARPTADVNARRRNRTCDPTVAWSCDTTSPAGRLSAHFILHSSFCILHLHPLPGAGIEPATHLWKRLMMPLHQPGVLYFSLPTRPSALLHSSRHSPPPGLEPGFRASEARVVSVPPRGLRRTDSVQAHLPPDRRA